MVLKAGFSKRDITPNLEDGTVFLAGFGHNRTALSVHDPIWVRCVVLDDGFRKLVLASLDLIGFFYEPDVLEVRMLISEKLGRDVYTVISCTHNHNAPDTIGLWGKDMFSSGLDEAYIELVRSQISEAVLEACSNLKPVYLRFAFDDRLELADLQGDSRPPIVEDPLMNIIQASDLQNDESVFTFIQWSNHPETLGGEGRHVTADFCGDLCTRLEAKLGGGVMYFNGAIGGLLSSLDIEKPLKDPETGLPAPIRSYRTIQLLGSRLSETATEALSKAEDVYEVKLKVKFRRVFIPVSNMRFKVLSARGITRGRPVYTEGKMDTSFEDVEMPGMGVFKGAAGKEILSEVGLIELGPAQIALVPGEIFPELVNGGLARLPGADFPEAPFEPIIREHMKAKYKLIIGLADDEVGYIIPEYEWDEKPPWLLAQPKPTYGEINSTGWKTARIVSENLSELFE